MLKEKLKEDGDKNEDTGAAVPPTDEEEDLIRELNELRDFVNNNKECIEDFFQIKRDSNRPEGALQVQPSAEELTPEERARRRKQKEL